MYAHRQAKRCKVTNKIKWTTQVDAGIALGRARSHILRVKQAVRTYECPHCGYWHLTSQPERTAIVKTPHDKGARS
jgi:hypothetical protein